MKIKSCRSVLNLAKNYLGMCLMACLLVLVLLFSYTNSTQFVGTSSVIKDKLVKVLLWQQERDKEIVNHDSQGSSPEAERPYHFLKEYLNPCWRSEQGLRCLPYFYLAGFPKCGTTDLFQRICKHPQVIPTKKEPQWVARRRFSSDNLTAPMDWYTDIYTKPFLKVPNAETSVTGDGSASTAWYNDHWPDMPGNENCSEPRVLNADYIRHINPDVKVIIIMRKPTDRLYSEYLYFSHRHNKKPEDFHSIAAREVDELTTCLKNRSLRSCAYDKTVSNPAKGKNGRLKIGMYHVFIEDWLARFPRDQIFLLRLEDLSANTAEVMKSVFQFLKLKVPESRALDRIEHQGPANSASKESKSVGPMLVKTMAMLDEFYQPFNRRLAQVLRDDRYLWRRNG